MAALNVAYLLLWVLALSQGVLSRFGLVVEARNITLPAGARAVLSCRSPRLVWTRDNLRDRQRVVHWDLVRRSPEYSVERVLDMSPGARQRVYNSFNKDRVSIPETAFNDGNFSLIINNVVATDKGVYTCNLHHHYCQVHRNIQIQLNVTKTALLGRREDRVRRVFVVLLGSSVVLPCVNRRPLWREGAQESQQQVVHWDYQAPGVRPDRAERLVDLYASGERRDYGPLFSQNKMSLDEDAFTLGDFSLSISDLKTADIGLYSCHLHHHYCGIQERRIFRLTVGAPPPSNPATSAPTTVQISKDIYVCVMPLRNFINQYTFSIFDKCVCNDTLLLDISFTFILKDRTDSYLRLWPSSSADLYVHFKQRYRSWSFLIDPILKKEFWIRYRLQISVQSIL
uniref:Matrix remodeling-associated protein 8 n=1 Tax=Periophthalmus magnuspinnatus TaxID=409849 RepID=A0A3B4AC71_9GOBI